MYRDRLRGRKIHLNRRFYRLPEKTNRVLRKMGEKKQQFERRKSSSIRWTTFSIR